MPISGQRSAQQAQRAGVQSARAMGRAARGSGGTTDWIVAQCPDGSWCRIGCDPETGDQVVEPYMIEEA